MSLLGLKRELQSKANPAQGKLAQRYFKTAPGEYGAGDTFLGIGVPLIRKVALAHLDLELSELSELLVSPIHEYRFAALEVLVAKYENTDDSTSRQEIVHFYLSQTERINNWDLV